MVCRENRNCQPASCMKASKVTNSPQVDESGYLIVSTQIVADSASFTVSIEKKTAWMIDGVFPRLTHMTVGQLIHTAHYLGGLHTLYEPMELSMIAFCRRVFIPEAACTLDTCRSYYWLCVVQYSARRHLRLIL